MTTGTARPMVSEIRIFLCDDTPELRRRVRAQLTMIDGLSVIGEADDPVDGLPVIGDLQPDVVLLDLSMPRMDGLEAIEHIQACAPDAGIIIYSGFLGVTMEGQALALGADRYVEKSQPLTLLVDVVRDVVAARRAGLRPVPTRSAPAPVHAPAVTTHGAASGTVPTDGEAAPRALPGDTAPAWAVLLAAGLLTAVVFALTLAFQDPRLGIGQLLVVPSAVLAVRFGLRAGLVAAALATLLVVLALEISDASPGVGGFVVRGIVFFVVAGLVGWFADHARQDIRHSTAVNTELERSNAELEQFAYIASHDLAEPLRTITGFTELLARRYGGELDEKADRYIEHIVGGTKRMQQLIDDLLAYSRVGRAEITAEPFSLEATLAQVRSALAGVIAERGALITHDALPTVLADPEQISQVLQNLINNAVKFQAAGEVPRVHVSAQHDGTLWRIDVRDNGIGIDPRFAQRIFRMFQRLHAQHEYSGTGIGLAICQRIVERNGGHIWVESQPGAGSTFSFTIPGGP